MNTLLHWYRNDLRSEDHAALAHAAAKGMKVLPLYILSNEEMFRLSDLPRWGKHRKQFLYQTLKDLADFWNKQGTELLILQGKPVDIIPQLCQKYTVEELSFAAAHASEEIALEQAVELALKGEKISIFKFYDDFLIHPDDLFCLPSQIPDVFTNFRKSVEANLKIRVPFVYDFPQGYPHNEKGISLEQINLNENSFVDTRSAFPFSGGERQAQIRIQDYFFTNKFILQYKETRNGLLGADYSTKFSPWLSLGAVSPRQIYTELKKFEQQHGANESTYWLVFELFWRDYFRYILIKYGRKIFLKNGLNIYNPNREVVQSDALFQSWILGKTGDDFVDACMHELAATGFMSNRGRQNVASYLVHQLKLDWRLGAEYFESMLIDYDAASNWGNWAYLAGVGNDPRQRIFNTQKQAEQYDQNGEFRKCWN